MIQKTTLVVMAAGMGSRFGGLKQAEPVTEDGKAILDFTVYDACSFSARICRRISNGLSETALQRRLKRNTCCKILPSFPQAEVNPSARGTRFTAAKTP